MTVIEYESQFYKYARHDTSNFPTKYEQVWLYIGIETSLMHGNKEFSFYGLTFF